MEYAAELLHELAFGGYRDKIRGDHEPFGKLMEAKTCGGGGETFGLLDKILLLAITPLKKKISFFTH